jgi:predicted nuclease of predicted toxin-antitoxin system
VKLLLDENLSRRLLARIQDLFPESLHVSSLNLLHAPDIRIWEYARENGYAIVSADADFYELAITLGLPPKVIWLRGCDYPNAVAEQIIRAESIRIGEFLNDPERSVLILRKR